MSSSSESAYLFRVTEDEVEALFDYVESSIDLTPFIAAAYYMVNQHVQDHVDDDDLLKEIERWLAAHFLAMRQKQTTKEDISGAISETYEGKYGLGLDFTRYGQQAKILDPTGNLSKAGTAKSGATMMFKAL